MTNDPPVSAPPTQPGKPTATAAAAPQFCPWCGSRVSEWPHDDDCPRPPNVVMKAHPWPDPADLPRYLRFEQETPNSWGTRWRWWALPARPFVIGWQTHLLRREGKRLDRKAHRPETLLDLRTVALVLVSSTLTALVVNLIFRLGHWGGYR